MRDSQNDRRIPLLLLLASIIGVAFSPAQYFGRQDDLLYYTASHSLSLGHYHHLGLVGAPPMVDTPPGLPALLLPLSFITDAPWAYQLALTIFLVFLPWTIYSWLKKHMPPHTAALAAFFAATSPLTLSQAGTLMSEIPYLLIFIAAMRSAEHQRPLHTGLAGGLLLLVRPAGLSTLPALVAKDVRARRWRTLAITLSVPIAAFTAWTAWSRSVSSGLQEVSELLLSYSGPDRNSLSRILADNSQFYFAALGSSFLPPQWGYSGAAIAVGAALAASMAHGLYHGLKDDPAEPAAWALIGALFMHLVWPWHYERYLIVLLPLVAWALAKSLRSFTNPALIILIAAQLGLQCLPRIGKPGPWDQPELSRTYAWLRSRPEPGALASALPLRDGWYTRRPGILLPDVETPREYHSQLSRLRTRFILRQDGLDVGLSAKNSSAVWKKLGIAFSALDDGEYFCLVHTEDAENARVYEILNQRPTHGKQHEKIRRGADR